MSLAVPVNSANGSGFVRFSTHQEDVAKDCDIFDCPWHCHTSFKGLHNGLQSDCRARFQHVGSEGLFSHHIEFFHRLGHLKHLGLIVCEGFNPCPTSHEEDPSQDPSCFFHLSHDHRTETIEVGYDPISKQCIRSLDDLAIATTTLPADVLSNADGSLNIFGGLREIFNMRLAAEFPDQSKLMGHTDPPGSQLINLRGLLQ